MRERWDIKTTHKFECSHCDDAADLAINRAEWSESSQDSYLVYSDSSQEWHEATVTRKDA